MANARIYGLMQVSDTTDYGLPIERQATMTTTTAAEYRIEDTIEAATGGTTYVLSHYTTLDWIMIENTDSTNFVTVIVGSGAEAGTFSIAIPASKFIVLTDVTAASNLTLTADTLATVLKISYSGT